ncbi:glutamate racemase [Solemya velesiana gill symbiont]|uniref:Glutamate racemase n=1 Tax=Solemya velesiana gill symbiont TaxID=1918948 RepID=A0A1T2KNP9_9GAMM|nr:glutamate racemase [Solemya velesiana gill symbiont]OOZ34503.1 glutamate racemase [Solemya velesiana gill symbiont]
MKPTSPIGVFDSGIGGLSILNHLHRELPNEDLIYVADSGFAPYGERSADEILARIRLITDFLCRREVKTIVVACNTATAVAIASLRQHLELPIVGVEPGLKPAANRTRSGTIGILATQGTLSSEKYNHLVNRHGREVAVISQVCNGLANQVEQGRVETQETRSMLTGYLEPMLQQGADTIALGCTHYPFLIPEIRKITGDEIAIIDTGPAVASEVIRRLEPVNRHPGHEREGVVSFFASGNEETAAERIGHYWPKPISVNKIPDL